MKLCPHCANPVEESALTCRFCRADLTSERLQRAAKTTDWAPDQETGMKNKIPRTWGYVLVAVLLGIALFFAGRSLVGSRKDSGDAAATLEEKAKELEEGNREVERLDGEIVQLKKELEENSKRMTELEAKLQEATKTLSSTKQKLEAATRAAERSASVAGQPRQREPPRPTDAVSPTGTRRPAEPGSYEVIRTTEIFEEPSESARRVSTIKKGTRVAVVRSAGEWLEVRSKHGNPPGFMRRDDVMLVEKAD